MNEPAAPRVYSEDQDVVRKVEHGGLTSTEAAALFLSEGRTMNQQEAEALASGQAFDMDDMQRAHLRRMMGFNFKVKITGRKLLVIAKEGPRVRTHAKIMPGDLDKFGNVASQELIDRLVEACLRLKVKWDKAQENKS